MESYYTVTKLERDCQRPEQACPKCAFCVAESQNSPTATRTHPLYYCTTALPLRSLFLHSVRPLAFVSISIPHPINHLPANLFPPSVSVFFQTSLQRSLLSRFSSFFGSPSLFQISRFIQFCVILTPNTFFAVPARFLRLRFPTSRQTRQDFSNHICA